MEKVVDAYLVKDKDLFSVHYWNPALQWRYNGHDGISKSQASRFFTQLVIQGQIKDNIKASHHWPLCGEVTGDGWIPHKKGQ